MILKFDKIRNSWHGTVDLNLPFYSPLTNKYYTTYEELEIDVKKFKIEVRKQKLFKISQTR